MFVSVLGFGFCCSVYPVVRKAHHSSSCCVVGLFESLVSWCSIFVFTRLVMKRPLEKLEAQTAANPRLSL